MPPITVPTAAQLSYSTAAYNAAVGARATALLDDFIAYVGTGWRLDILQDGVVKIRFTGTSLLPRAGRTVVVAQTSVTSVSINVAASLATGVWTGRLTKSDGTVAAEGTAGAPGSGRDFLVSISPDGTATPTINPSVVFGISSTFDVPLSHVVSINVGGDAYTSADGTVYLSDRHFVGGTQATPSAAPISGTADDILFQTERWGVASWPIPVTASTYQVEIGLAEMFASITAPGQRVFSITINPGTPSEVTIPDIDIFAAVGLNAAYVVTRTVPSEGGYVTIRTNAQVQNPKISYITLRSATGGEYAPPPPGTPGVGSEFVFATPLQVAADFRRADHSAPCSYMPDFSQKFRGRPYGEDSKAQALSDSLSVVPWFTCFGAGTKPWPTNVGVQVGRCEVWMQSATTNVWTMEYYWIRASGPAGDYFFSKQARDDFGFPLGGIAYESVGTDNNWYNFCRVSSDGHLIFKRTPSAGFETVGTNIHGFWEGHDGFNARTGLPAGGGRIQLNRTNAKNVVVRCKVRAVQWPSASGQAIVPNPSWDQTSVIFGLGMDSYQNGPSGAYRDDIGIAQHVYVTNEWTDRYLILGKVSDFLASPPPGVV